MFPMQRFIGGFCCVIFGSWTVASEPESRVAELTRVIDQHLATRWDEAEVIPAAVVSDAQFLRRVYLDLAGTIPPVSEVRDFLRSTDPNKRADLVDRLLNSSNYVTNFTNVWRSLLLPEAETDLQVRYVALEFEAWLRSKISANVPYDQIAREIISVPLGQARGQGPYAYYSGQRAPQPTAFYSAKEIKPENLAAATARVFMGTRVDCAQCHDHPFADWTQEQFWEFAAFFGGIKRNRNGVFGSLSELFQFKRGKGLEIKIPDKDKTVTATFLDGTRPEDNAIAAPRELLADWLVSEQNPYFARAVTNRLWAHFFGVGLVDPVDDLDVANPPSHPELLDELSREFAANGYDVKFLIRAMTGSYGYQLASEISDAKQSDPRLFARMRPKSMSAEQLYRSISQASGRPATNLNEDLFSGINQSGPRQELERLFIAGNEPAADRQMSVLQALMLMNGTLVAEATRIPTSATLTAVSQLPMSTEQRIETLFLATVSRFPTTEELERFVGYVGADSAESGKVYGDVFWALLNSSEFSTNH